MDICFLTNLNAKATGVDRYSINLMTFMAESKEHNFFSSSQTNIRGIKNIALSPPNNFFMVRVFYNNFFVPLKIKKYNFDVLHGLNAWIPFYSFREKIVLTVHDLTPIIFPDYHSSFNSFSFRQLAIPAFRRSNLLIADSESTKSDLIQKLGIDKEKIKVVYLGVEHDKFHPIEDELIRKRIRQKYSLPDKFLFFVGTIEPRKNVLGLIKAYSIVRKKNTDCKLVIAGKKGWKFESVFQFMETHSDLRKEIVFLDYVSEEDLPALYSMAEVFIYPTFYEGFGLPPLEAMACGTPVISSNISSIPEIAGDAAILIDPKNIEKLADNILSLLNDENKRSDFAKAGIKQANRFSWEKTATETLEAYQYILKK